jgi:hypothetical protein
MELSALIADFAFALRETDATQPVGSSGRFKPGCGPLTESEVTGLIIRRLRSTNTNYGNAAPMRYPGGRTECDLVLPGQWAIELKLARPYGDNGKPAERWSENLLYPYPGNTSSLGDCLKLLGSQFSERKAVLVIGYEHTPPKIPLEPAVRGFEILASEVLGLNLTPRQQVTVSGLVHPCHQQATVYVGAFGVRASGWLSFAASAAHGQVFTFDILPYVTQS